MAGTTEDAPPEGTPTAGTTIPGGETPEIIGETPEIIGETFVFGLVKNVNDYQSNE